MKLGILGGGQLAQMLAEAASQLGLELHIFADAPASPAERVSPNVITGKFEKAPLRDFLKDKTHIIFESEFVDTNLLQEASQGLSTRFFPGLKVMELFQDKLSQKHFCIENGLPTSEFAVYEAGDVLSWCQEAVQKLGGSAVFKWAKLGYDGKGNFFARGDHDTQALATFVESALVRGSRVYAEKMINFESELAVIGVRSPEGASRQYPVVYSEQSKGICLNVKGPATSFGLPHHLSEVVSKITETVGSKGGIIGAFAVELFLRGEEVFVNEIAPRVHNTGHYTQDAAQVSQFENHVRACIGYPLGSVITEPFFAMRNILGPNITLDEAAAPVPSETSRLHWYGKKGIRPGRKLGHINTYSSTQPKLEIQVQSMIDDEKRWVQVLTR